MTGSALFSIVGRPPSRWFISVLVTLIVALLCFGSFNVRLQSALADSPGENVQAANASVQRAITASRAGDLATAQREYQSFKTNWPTIEDGVQAANRDEYRAIEARMRDVDAALVAQPPDKNQLIVALTVLDEADRTFVQDQNPAGSSAGASASSPAPAAPPAASAPSTAPRAQGPATVATLVQQLSLARAALDRGDYSAATEQFKAFENTWPDVEGQVKTRSATAYSQTEDDMGLLQGLLSQRSPEAKTVLDRMQTRLQPYQQTAHYGVFDAAIILLREGLEALLVLVALLAVLQRSGNPERRSWIWGGAGVGLLLSILLGVGLHIALGSVMNSGNRELIEGITGVVAAGMLLYVSYWLHSNTSIKGWHHEIHDRTRQALTTGSLFGLAFLAFLAVFREGAETVLFYLGMAADISTRSLLLGLGAGALGLVVLGALILGVGIRIPMRPFFAVASLLVFYLCFKFLGTGIQALQVAGVLPSSSATYLPSSGTFGLSPTWQTTIPQLLLLMVAVGVLLQGWLKQRSFRGAQTGARQVHPSTGSG